MSRVFLSHASQDNVQAQALKLWLTNVEPGLADEIFLDLDPHSGIPAGVRWKEALRRANDRCEAVICLLSEHWDASHECKTEYRTAEERGKPIFPVRLRPSAGRDITNEWQRCDLFGEGPKTPVVVDGHEPVEFLTEGLLRLRNGLRAAGIAPDSFAWPPEGEPDRVPYRGWQPLEAVDAAVYFGRDAEINRALTAIRGLRSSGGEKAFVILGPSGVGKSSFLRAGLLPRLGRDDRHFLVTGIVRPERYPLTGGHGLACSIHSLRAELGLDQPALGTIKAGIGDPSRVRGWLAEAQRAALDSLVDASDTMPPTIVLPIDQAEELFGADAGDEAPDFLTLVAGLLGEGTPELPIIVVGTIRADRYEPLQTAPQLEGLGAHLFDDLKPMPQAQFREVICGPAERAAKSGSRLVWAPELVERLLADCASGADTLPLLALTLARLYHDYGNGAVGLAEYDAMGGVRRVVESEINEVLATDPEIRNRQLEQLHAAFIPWLATINPDNDQPMRRVARWLDVPADSHPLLDALVARRLLVKDERDGEVIVEVALESLLRQWDTLAGWLAAEATNLKDTDAVEQAVRAWEHNARHEDWLLEGTRLAEAEALAAKPGFRERLNTAREFLLASRRRADQRSEAQLRAAEALADAERNAKDDAERYALNLQRRSRVLRAVMALTAIVALVAVFGFGWALKARGDAADRARDATAMRLYAQSQLMLAGQFSGGNDDVLGMQTLLAAHSIPSKHQGTAFPLLTALQQERDLLKIIDVPTVVTSVAFSPDGRRIVSSSLGSENVVRQWDSQTGQPIGEPLRGHDGSATSAIFSPDGGRIASTGLDNTIRLWDAATGQPIGEPLRGHDAVVISVVFSPDGRRLASTSADKTIRLWDAATRQPIGEPLRGHDREVQSVVFSPDGGRLASGSRDGTIRRWDVATGQPIGEPLRGHDDVLMSVAISPDGRRLASASADKTIRLWDATTGQPIGEPLRGHDNVVASVAFSPDGRRLASGSADNTIRLWDAATGRSIGTLRGHRAAVEKVAFSPDSRHVVSGGDDRTVRLWDATSWQPMLGHDGPVFAEFRDNGGRIASGSTDKTVRSWDTATGQPIGEPLRVGGDDVLALFPDDEGRLVSTGSMDTMRFWDSATREPVGEPLRLPPDPNRPMAYSAEGRRIAAVTSGTVQLWDAKSMRPVGQPIRPDAPVNFIAFSPDGRIVATGSKNWTVQLWDATTGTPVGAPMTGNGWINRIDFSPDGHLLAAWNMDHTLRLWNTQTFQPVGDPLHVDAVVTVAAFSPDGKRVASGSGDGTIRMWNVGDQTQLGAALTGHTAGVTTLEFSPDGTRLLSASVDHTLRLWPVPDPSPEALCAKLTHNMSLEQWNNWVSPDIEYVQVCPNLPRADDAG